MKRTINCLNAYLIKTSNTHVYKLLRITDVVFMFETHLFLEIKYAIFEAAKLLLTIHFIASKPKYRG